jgi:phosphate transport system substrate-binding protein
MPRLDAGGSTFNYPMMSKWAVEYEKAKGVKVHYQAIGSGGGIQNMTTRAFDFGCTDRPMNQEQLEECQQSGSGVLHIPLVMGAVVPVYNLEEVDKPLRFSGPLLADIFLGKVTRWNDRAVVELNPNATLPDKEIVVVYRAGASGTSYVWADYLSKVSAEWKQKVSVGASVNWPIGIGYRGGDGIGGMFSRTPGAIGYVELIYALQNEMKVGCVKNKEDEFVQPSLKSITAAAASSLPDFPEDLCYSITNAIGKESYPICGTVWAVVYENQPTGKGREVIDFLRWVLHDGQELAEPLMYARLPEGLIEKASKKLDQVNVGQ